MEREARDLREGFAIRNARQHAPAVGELCERWEPDVLVCDEADFGGMIAAERAGAPHARLVTLAAGSLIRAELLAEPLDALRAEHGLPPDPELEMLDRHLVLSPFPPSFRDPAFPPPATLHAFRSGERAPEVVATDPPTVYFTLGTEFNLESGDLFERVLGGLGELPVEVVATVGSELDPAVLGTQPGNVKVERYVPQSEILPRTSAVVCHGGSGSVLGALAHGLPLVLLPMGADQPQNADRCAALGVGLVLDVIAATPEDVRDAVSAVLSEPSYRAAAERIRDEIAALPEARSAAPDVSVHGGRTLLVSKPRPAVAREEGGGGGGGGERGRGGGGGGGRGEGGGGVGGGGGGEEEGGGGGPKLDREHAFV